ncbi:MAG: peptidase [Burkholderiales bacterium]|nr:MAG: peptidase [Burkholderiales bacterium]
MATKKTGKSSSTGSRKPVKKAAKPASGRAKPGRQGVDKRAANTDALQQSGFMAAAQGEAKTVIYVHGIGNKPTQEVLRCQWDKALFGRGMGERTRLAYWVNRERYPTPEPGSCGDRDQGPTINQAEQRVLSALGVAPSRDDLDQLASALADSPAEAAMLHNMLSELGAGNAAGRGPGAKGLLDKVNEILLKMISAALLQDVHDFFFDRKRREQMERSLLDRMESGGGPFVIVAHSQGSMIAYEVLRKLDPAKYDVALFVTVGSPLGLPSVRSMFKQAINKKKLPFPACVRHWYNVADRRDPVALDGNLTDDIENPGQRFSNLQGSDINTDSPRNPHSGSGYLSNLHVRAKVRDVVGVGFDQPVSNTVLIKDLSDQLEANGAEHRHEVLIELDKLPAGDGGREAARNGLLDRIRSLAVTSTGLKSAAIDDAICLEDGLQRFVSARLTRFEIESLRNDYQALSFKRLWRDAGKRALLNQSRSVIQADAAQTAYNALGQKIGWAVLDTGIAAGHPHFYERGKRDVVAAQWDCTVRGKPRKLLRADGVDFSKLDRNGHGTHVAGVIAGQCAAPLPGGAGADKLLFSGIAPQAQLYGFKVLDDDGNGRDSWIIKAVQQVAEINDQAGELVIHGMNLSLGGYFDAESYGCGFTPLCNELRRLWRQGVVVVLAAGNEGLAWLVQNDGESYPANMDMTIGDPANLEEAIAVGSVHKANPHSYGVSYFSSRGPTADGRNKPDIVAPGEKIISAHHGFKASDPKTWMVEMSGTSMAAPHVSGLIAGFLSVRREFIGFPDRVKRIVLDNSTDIGRDRYMQGRGIPNLIKMLAST